MKTQFRSPLTIYALWHPKCTEGKLLATGLFDTYSRNSKDPFSRTMGLPVYFRSASKNESSESPIEIPFEESVNTAIVVFVDLNMVESDDWWEYVSDLSEKAAESEGRIRLFPIAFDFDSFLFKVIASTNFIRLFEVPEANPMVAAAPAISPKPTNADESEPNPPIAKIENESPSANKKKIKSRNLNAGQFSIGEGRTINININLNLSDFLDDDLDEEIVDLALEAAPEVDFNQEYFDRKASFLTGKLSHELSRMVYGHPSLTEKGTVQSSPPIQLFISHAKADGSEIAEAIRNHIHSDTSLKSFFDANDIAPGYRFDQELLSHIEKSALICIQTDYYATREWCLWEVINAKRLDRPVVVANAVKEIEPRAFPYIGNVPTQRWNYDHPVPKIQIQEIIDLCMFEVLSVRYQDMFQKELIRVFELPETTGVVGHPPELFTILRMNKDEGAELFTEENPRLVIYPDPPLGDEEIKVLEDLAPHIRFITPTLVPLLSEIN